MEGRALVSVIERRHFMIVKDPKRVVNAAFVSEFQHPGNNTAVVVRKPVEDPINAVFLRHLAWMVTGIRVPKAAANPSRHD